jgi:hypothetical protein
MPTPLPPPLLLPPLPLPERRKNGEVRRTKNDEEKKGGW